MKREELLVADIDIDKATHAMFHYDLEATARVNGRGNVLLPLLK